MKPIVRHIISGTILGLLTVLFGVLLFISGQRRDGAVCKGVEIIVKDSLRNRFISKSDVMSFLREECGSPVEKKVDEIDLSVVESSLRGRSAIKECEAFFTPDGILNIEISQREPAVRFQTSSLGYYSDNEGFIFPLQRNHTAHVPIIDGNIPLDIAPGFKGEPKTEKEKEWLKKMLFLADCINSDRNWKEDIAQISVRSNGDIVMIPREGREMFLFGSPDRVKEKLSLMERYYTEIVPAKGVGTYSNVSVQFEGQIVCRK